MKAILLVIGLFCVLAMHVTAVAVGSPYLPDNTMKIPEELSGEYTITLQNVGETEVFYRVKLNSNIAEIVDEKDVYVVGAGVTNFPVTFRVEPGDASLGEVYDIEYVVTAAESEGTLPVALGIAKHFKVEIVQNPDKVYFGSYMRDNGLLWGFLFIVIVGYVWYKRNERKKKR